MAPAAPVGSDTSEWHALSVDEAVARLGTRPAGLTTEEALERLAAFGPNQVPTPGRPWGAAVFVRQFRSPLIYILLVAAAVSAAVGHATDAAVIGAVLLLNASIGAFNELRAEEQVRSLQALLRSVARVRRDGHATDVDGAGVVPGDLVILESGMRVPADLRLLDAHALRVDESLLTGESLPSDKRLDERLPLATPVAERSNLAFSGTHVVAGRALGVVVATGVRTQVGSIAAVLAEEEPTRTPLVYRMERFARRVGVAVVGIAVLLFLLGTLRGLEPAELILGSIALAVSAIPEGLPVALTVALAVAVSRMARRKVIVRNLPAVEALGSCTVIATDKTGTLTRNELTVERVQIGSTGYRVSGIGYVPRGELMHREVPVVIAEHPALFRLIRAAALANEATLVERAAPDAGWDWSGDPTDVALLSLAYKAGIDPIALAENHPVRDSIPFEPERRFAASIHGGGTEPLVCVKGALERVLPMCDRALSPSGAVSPLAAADVRTEAERLMRGGYRVLAVADGRGPTTASASDARVEPSGLVLLGLVGMTDPPRERVPDAVARCRGAGVHVAMITGDHATTGQVIATRIGLATPDDRVLTGPEMEALDDAMLPSTLERTPVIARATPTDKLRAVRAFQQRGEFVAVTGDGANDAPALKSANLGVAMGLAGTDVAREAADLVVADDDFSSIVSGIEEGRVAYENVRKVTYLLISTGFGEVLLVVGALAVGLPLPLTAVQLLWLNLVTNGIQDVALAFEPREGNVLGRPPRSPHEPVLDRLMLERTIVAGLVFGGVGLGCWFSWMSSGVPVEVARSSMVQLFVLFEIFHIGNARSETRSMFRLSPLANPVLLLGTLGALGVHLAATYTPTVRSLLHLAPTPLPDWVPLAAYASSVIVVMEVHKAARSGTLRAISRAAISRN